MVYIAFHICTIGKVMCKQNVQNLAYKVTEGNQISVE